VQRAIALIATWQQRNDRPFDFLIQVGDLPYVPIYSETTPHPGLVTYIGPSREQEMTVVTSHRIWKLWKKGLDTSSIGWTGITTISDRLFPGVL
jgi:hypothetical protein